jgi:hypothetical protein
VKPSFVDVLSQIKAIKDVRVIHGQVYYFTKLYFHMNIYIYMAG